ncbi:MrcB family domain-containing protein [Mycobacterium asiaticum]|uniref:MrcB family domain-containing protein n=1 Tax=Mycobacterium asiaticum TaxID=1790 RepID=UPI0009BF7701
MVFLFSAAGDRIYLSLNQGTTRWDGAEFRRQPEALLVARPNWARSVLMAGAPFPPKWNSNPTRQYCQRARHRYALGNVVAPEYLLDEIPADAEIEQDLLQIIGWLGQIHRAADEGLYVPGDSPDVADTSKHLTSSLSHWEAGKGRALG